MKKNIFLIMASLLFAVGFAEVLWRGGEIANDYYIGKKIAVLSPNPTLGYEFRPNYTRGPIRTNSHGFRGTEFAIAKQKNVYRIVVLGDSIPFGVRMDEKFIFPVLLGQNRQDPFLQGKELEVINAGIGGYNIWQYNELYKTKIAQLRPDLVIVSVCQNDFEQTGPYFKNLWGIVQGDEVTRKSDGTFLSNFHLYNRLFLTFRTLLLGQRQQLKEQDIPKLSMKWEQGGKPLLELITRIKADGTPLLFVIFPYQFQVVEKEKQTDPVFSSFMKDHSVPVVDMLFPFSIADANLYLKNDMIHLNKAGHQLAAEAIWDSLTKM